MQNDDNVVVSRINSSDDSRPISGRIGGTGWAVTRNIPGRVPPLFAAEDRGTHILILSLVYALRKSNETLEGISQVDLKQYLSASQHILAIQFSTHFGATDGGCYSEIQHLLSCTEWLLRACAEEAGLETREHIPATYQDYPLDCQNYIKTFCDPDFEDEHQEMRFGHFLAENSEIDSLDAQSLAAIFTAPDCHPQLLKTMVRLMLSPTGPDQGRARLSQGATIENILRRHGLKELEIGQECTSKSAAIEHWLNMILYNPVVRGEDSELSLDTVYTAYILAREVYRKTVGILDVLDLLELAHTHISRCAVIQAYQHILTQD
ncbi:Hypothetical protein D9617_84g045800 [Elsinoe fawcettii]|nr:Hypothetical protein D9617_84g045800 [Elsinoe fawcettii]